MNKTALYDVIRSIKGSGLTQSEVDNVERTLTPTVNAEALFSVIRSIKPKGGLTQAEVDQVNALIVDSTAAAPTTGQPFLNHEAFRQWAPEAVPGTVRALELAIAKYPALQPRPVLKRWLGNMHVESMGFSQLTESLNYSVEALIKKFGRHRISEADARRYGRSPQHAANQQAIANLLYGGPWGKENLGNEAHGDGWAHRGAGFLQMTGKANQEKYGGSAEALMDPVVSADAAARFFIDKGCVRFAAAGDDAEVCRRINGGSNALAERIQRAASADRVIR